MARSAYDGITVTPDMLEAVLVRNSQNQWFRFQFWEDRIFIMDRVEEYENYKDFDSGWHDSEEEVEELRGLYTALYGVAPPNLAGKVTLTKAIWAKRYFVAQDRTKDYVRGGSKNHVTGQRERKRNLDGRRYRALEGDNSVHLQDQALVVWRELLKFQQNADRETISEAEVRSCMEAAAKNKILKTKQDPFRIFQYYRGALIKANKLEMFE